MTGNCDCISFAGDCAEISCERGVKGGCRGEGVPGVIVGGGCGVIGVELCE